MAKRKQKRKPPTPFLTARQLLTQVVAMTDAFCQAHLNEEYRILCRKLAEKLAAKRPSPLLRGKLEAWACGIVRTIGWVNFLDDRSQSPRLEFAVIDRAFGVGESTAQGRVRSIRQYFKIHPFDHRWMLPSRWDREPMVWTLQDSNGSAFDVRKESVSVQRAAFRKGLIPYVPADRAVVAVKERIATSNSRRLFQFKITLRGIEPTIWRRIQVWDDTMDKLHEHFQAAMGWTNSHLHEFLIQGKRCGDPELLEDDDLHASSGLDSTQTLMSAVLPPDGARFAFEYVYDFGDDWVHDVVFEGSPSPQPNATYPQCLEGERACPPEDVGGIWGYEEYLKAMADPKHENHEEMHRWRGPFDPNGFAARFATHAMQEGVVDWRNMV